MDNNEQRDYAEELDAAMIPFRENCELVFAAGWNVNNLLDYMKDHCPQVGQEYGGGIVLYTGLIDAPDGSLWKLKETKEYEYKVDELDAWGIEQHPLRPMDE